MASDAFNKHWPWPRGSLIWLGGGGAQEQVDLSGLGVQGRPLRQHLLIFQVFIEPLLSANAGWGSAPT